MDIRDEDRQTIHRASVMQGVANSQRAAIARGLLALAKTVSDGVVIGDEQLEQAVAKALEAQTLPLPHDADTQGKLAELEARIAELEKIATTPAPFPDADPPPGEVVRDELAHRELPKTGKRRGSKR